MNDQKIGNYTLEKVLGGGLGSTTYQARDESSQLVCLKEFNLSHSAGWKSLDLFQREAETLRQLDHPQIPKLRDYFKVEKDNGLSQYFVMNYVEGASLADRLSQGHQFTFSEVLEIAKSVLPVLQYLHSQTPPVIHRDIKPSNLIQSAEGKIVVVDFGSVQERVAGIVGGSTIAGTYGYAPLENYSGNSSPRSDVYSLGMTLFELLTKQKPGEVVGYDNKHCLQLKKKVLPEKGWRRLLQEMTALQVEKRLTVPETLARILDLEKSYNNEHYSFSDYFSQFKSYFSGRQEKEKKVSLTIIGNEAAVKGVKLGLAYTGKSSSVIGANLGAVAVADNVTGVNAGGAVAIADNVTGINASEVFADAGADNNVTGVNAGGAFAFAGYNVTGVNAGGVFAGAANVTGVNAGGAIAFVADNITGVNAGGAFARAANVTGVNAGGAFAFAGYNVTGVNAGGAFAGADNVTGVNAGGVFACADNNVTGVNASGAIALADNVTGVNASGAIALAGNVTGVNASGAIAFVADNITGVNAGGLASIVFNEMNGLQLGLINYARSGDNLQLGLINLSGPEAWYKKKASFFIGINRKKK